MHSDRVLSGKAFIIIRPSLFLSGLMMMLNFPSQAMDNGIILKTDSGTYVCHVEYGADSLDMIWKRAADFATSLKYPEKIENDPEIDELAREISASFGFYLYKQTAFLKQVDGIITAELHINMEQEEFDAVIMNIYFVDYARDRYGKYSPRSSRKYLLNDLQKKKKNNEIWQDHFSAIDEKMNLLLSELLDSISVENAMSGR